MAFVNLDSTPYHIKDLDIRVCVIQNLGPGFVYMDSKEDVTDSTGFKIEVGGVYETATSGGYSDIYLMTDSDAEVRIVSI